LYLPSHTNTLCITFADFGSSCFEEERMYTYIQSRFYRSPEVLLGLPYDTAIDMWSFGCILAELYTGYPLFHGENEAEQLLCVMEIMGLPPMDMVAKSTRQSTFFDANLQPKIVANSHGKKRRPGAKDLPSVLRCNDPLFIDFLEKCLRWDARERFTPEQALQHEWVTQGDRKRAQTAGTSTAGVPSSSHHLPPPPQQQPLQPQQQGHYLAAGPVLQGQPVAAAAAGYVVAPHPQPWGGAQVPGSAVLVHAPLGHHASSSSLAANGYVPVAAAPPHAHGYAHKPQGGGGGSMYSSQHLPQAQQPLYAQHVPAAQGTGSFSSAQQQPHKHQMHAAAAVAAQHAHLQGGAGYYPKAGGVPPPPPPQGGGPQQQQQHYGGYAGGQPGVPANRAALPHEPHTHGHPNGGGKIDKLPAI
jgi:serine/threonine protein kinase